MLSAFAARITEGNAEVRLSVMKARGQIASDFGRSENCASESDAVLYTLQCDFVPKLSDFLTRRNERRAKPTKNLRA